ncbi:transposase, partial [Enterococcus faecium]
ESQKRGRKISMNSKLNIPKKLKDESLEEEVIRLRAENAYLKKWNGNTFFDKNYKVL